MARRAAKVDDNQAKIVERLRQLGYSVSITSAVGNGFPDIVVGGTDRAGVVRCWLFEIKDGSKPPSARKLTDDQVKWHREWKGQVAVIESAADALFEMNLD